MLESYRIIAICIFGVVLAATGALVVAHVIGPARRGKVKDQAYESGMPVVHDIQRRFNIRFYIIAMLFLLFDVEIVFIWPWAEAFYESCTNGTGAIIVDDGTVATKGFLLFGMGMFFLILLLGLVYEWKKGAFEWD
jgi:NADH-quinone oxidoreductase subunit A